MTPNKALQPTGYSLGSQPSAGLGRYASQSTAHAGASVVKDTWYSDHRDLVKWGALVHISRREQIPNIIQVAFLRNGNRPPIEIDGQQYEIADEVWAHFRDVARIRELADTAGLKITLIDRQFNSRERIAYIQHVIEVINQQPAPRIILLDPDTGIEPAKATPQHVKTSDIQNIWRSLNGGDWLVLYQHASRQANWRDESRSKFANACGSNGASTIQAPRIASDVAFFATRKQNSSQEQLRNLVTRKNDA